MQKRNKSWVKLYRSLSNDPIWTEGVFSEGQAWVDLIINSSYKKGTVHNKKGSFEVRKGQLLVSQRKLTSRWKWHRSRLRRFLNRLETLGKIKHKYEKGKGVIITILDYQTYQ